MKELNTEITIKASPSVVWQILTLVPLLWKSLDTKTRQGFEAMNQALQLKAEQQ